MMEGLEELVMCEFVLVMAVVIFPVDPSSCTSISYLISDSRDKPVVVSLPTNKGASIHYCVCVCVRVYPRIKACVLSTYLFESVLVLNMPGPLWSLFPSKASNCKRPWYAPLSG